MQETQSPVADEIKTLTYKNEERPMRSASISKLASALAKAQGEMENADKDAKGTYGKYATLAATWEAIRGPLSKHGISIYQRPLMVGSKLVMATMILHESGEFFDDGELELKFENNNRMTAMQALGSAVTYARRYTLQAATGIAPSDDDDGAAAGNPDPKGKPQGDPKGKPQGKPGPASAPQNHAPVLASGALIERLQALMQERGVPDVEVTKLLEHGYRENPKQPTEKSIKAIIALIDSNNDQTIAEAFVQHLDALDKARAKPQGTKREDPKDPALFVMPVGTDDVKGKALKDLTEAKLKSIRDWASNEMKKTPPANNVASIIEIHTQVKKFLHSVGVE